jgi:pyruvate formate lyase activating enzyme
VEGLTAESLFEQLLPALEMCGNNGGITLSGGEALLQREGAKKLLELCKARNIHTAMETSGLLPLDLYREALPLVDLWLFGMRLVAGFQDERRNDAVKSALALLKENRAFVQPVLPMVPRVYDKDEVLEDVAALLSEYGLGKPLLNPWNRNYDALYKEAGIPLRMKAPSAEAVESCESKMRAYFKES